MRPIRKAKENNLFPLLYVHKRRDYFIRCSWCITTGAVQYYHGEKGEGKTPLIFPPSCFPSLRFFVHRSTERAHSPIHRVPREPLPPHCCINNSAGGTPRPRCLRPRRRQRGPPRGAGEWGRNNGRRRRRRRRPQTRRGSGASTASIAARGRGRTGEQSTTAHFLFY